MSRALIRDISIYLACVAAVIGFGAALSVFSLWHLFAVVVTIAFFGTLVLGLVVIAPIQKIIEVHREMDEWNALTPEQQAKRTEYGSCSWSNR